MIDVMSVAWLKKLKNSFPWMWNAVEWCNGILISLFFGGKIRKSADAASDVEGICRYRRLDVQDAGLLVSLIKRQPDGFDRYFKPHPFDIDTFRRILGNSTYLLMGAFDGEELVGYCFMRFFINKSAFRGKIVDKEYQGRGIAKQMGVMMTKIASDAGFKVYATISRENVASLQSARHGSQIKVMEELPDDYLYVQILPDDRYVS